MGPTTTTSNPGGAGLPLPPRVHHPKPPGRLRGHQTSVRERQAIVAIALVAGVVGAFSAGEPTSYKVSDVILRGGTAAVVTLATSRARRWTWLVLGGIAVIGAPGGWCLAVSGLGLAFGFVTTLFARRRIYGAIVGATAVQGLLRFDDIASPAYTATLVAVALVPVFGSAYFVAPARVRRRIHWGLIIFGGLALAATILFGIAAGLAYSSTQKGVKQATAGLAAARDGHGDDAAAQLREADESFSAAHDLVAAWWARPAGAVPVVAQQARAVEVVTEEGASVARVSASAVAGADIQQLKYTDGRIDVARLKSLQAPLEATASAFAQASTRVSAVRSPWLVGPLADRIDDFDRQLLEALPEAELAAAAAKTAPDLLGASGARRYLVLCTQPSEARGLGGFVGNWLELTAIDGRLELTRSGRAVDINEAPGAESRTVTSPPVPQDYIQRYGRFRPGAHFQDVTLSPDLPSVAAAAAQIYGQVPSGAPIDGVIAIDPYALAALLQFTGPITVTGYDQPLTSQNAAAILVRDQYTVLAGNEAREDFLDEAARETFDVLVHGSLPSPKKLAEVLGPMVEQGRLAFAPSDADGRSLLARVHADGAFRARDGSDFFQIGSQNNANNKIDMFLRRTVDYDVKFDPVSGSVEATMTVELHNDAPADGLPPSVIGSNDQHLPPGTNRMYFSVYTPLGLRSATVDDEATPLEFQKELGYSVYSSYLEIPAGGSVTVQLALFGQLDPSTTYRLAVGHQPLVNPDQVTVQVRATTDWEFIEVDGLRIDPGAASASARNVPTTLEGLSATLARP